MRALNIQINIQKICMNIQLFENLFCEINIHNCLGYSRYLWIFMIFKRVQSPDDSIVFWTQIKSTGNISLLSNSIAWPQRIRYFCVELGAFKGPKQRDVYLSEYQILNLDIIDIYSDIQPNSGYSNKNPSNIHFKIWVSTLDTHVNMFSV